MNTKSNKGLLFLLALLVATNLGMLWYFTRTPQEQKPKSRSEAMAEYVKKELQFSDEQVKQYFDLRRRRDSLLAPLQSQLRAAKMDMMQLLAQPTVSDSVLQLAAQRVGAAQAPLEVEYHNHFRRMMTLCTPQQKPLFEKMLERMVRRSTGDTTQAQRPQ